MPIEELIQSAGSGGALARPAPAAPTRSTSPAAALAPARTATTVPPVSKPQIAPAAPSFTAPRPTPTATSPAPAPAPMGDASLKDAFLSEVRKSNAVLYNTVVVQAQRIEVTADRIVLSYTAAQKIGPTFDKYRPVLEASATRLAGRKMTVVAETSAAETAATGGETRPGEADRKSALKEEALADAGVQAMLEVFPAEIRDVEEM
jgi:hypothetical protein